MTDISLNDHQVQAAALRKVGIAAARAGPKARARRYLHQSIALDAGAEETWLWLARVATTPQAKGFYLRQTLLANLRNQWALVRLREVEQGLASAVHTRSPLLRDLRSAICVQRDTRTQTQLTFDL